MTGKKPLADIKYFFAAMNPFSSRIKMREDLMNIYLEAYKWDVIGRNIFKTGGYDTFLSKWLIDRFGGRGGNFIDVGANLGYFTCLLGVLASSGGRVISIEPEPANLDLLRTNVESNDLVSIVKIFPFALGAREGTARLNLYKKSNRGRHSLVTAQSGDSITVPVKRLDFLIHHAFENNQNIDFLKIDVEGYEPYVIEGAGDVFDRIQCMVMEYAPYLLKNASADLPAMFSTLEKRFSKIHLIHQNGFELITSKEILRLEGAVDLIFER